MWLPQGLYESIPFDCLVIGCIGLGGAFLVDDWYWPEIFAAAGTLFWVIGLMLLLRRKGYRASRSRQDFKSRG